MQPINPTWRRHDAHRFIRHDAHRFMAPDPNAYRSYASRLVEQRKAEEERVACDVEVRELHEHYAAIRTALAELKFELTRRQLCRKYGYNPNQARVPAGSSDGGQWTDGVRAVGSAVAAGASSQAELSDVRLAAMSMEERVRKIFGQKELFTEVGAGSGGGGGGGAPWLPTFSSKGPTAGVLRASGKDTELVSGVEGPASKMPWRGSGFDILNRTHVEGHAAAIMRNENLSEATLFMNNPKGSCLRCVGGLPFMLPPYSTLNIVSPKGIQIFRGLPR